MAYQYDGYTLILSSGHRCLIADGSDGNDRCSGQVMFLLVCSNARRCLESYMYGLAIVICRESRQTIQNRHIDIHQDCKLAVRIPVIRALYTFLTERWMERLVLCHSHCPIFSFLIWMTEFLDHSGEDLSVDLRRRKR